MRGSIGVYRIGRDHAEWVGTALSEPFHLSFPYVFSFQGRHYMIPETHESRQIRLYETDSFPLGWRLKHVLMENVSAVDTMVFEWLGRWWLLASMDVSNSGDHTTELFAFFANDLLTDRWIPHAANPVLIAPDGGRNAGILRRGDELFRVAQRQGFELYGQGASIRRIVTLDRDTFAEVKVADLTPDFRSDALGIHHFHSAGGLTVFDFVRRTR